MSDCVSFKLLCVGKMVYDCLYGRRVSWLGTKIFEPNQAQLATLWPEMASCITAKPASTVSHKMALPLPERQTPAQLLLGNDAKRQ
jgi:hypothetical protein